MTSPKAITSWVEGSQIRSGLSIGRTISMVSRDLRSGKLLILPSSEARRIGLLARALPFAPPANGAASGTAAAPILGGEAILLGSEVVPAFPASVISAV